MFTIKAIIMGIIQGLTEFIPVSSSGHLVFANHFLGFEIQDISFDIIVHLGTALAVIVYFRKDILALLTSLVNFGSKNIEDIRNRKLLFFLAIATLVTGIIGILVKDYIESIFHNPLTAAIMLILTGFILFVTDTFESKKQLLSSDVGVFRAVIIGLAQAFAIMPGISRSGSTIAAGTISGLKRSEAARFSFLLSVPAILGAALLSIKKISVIEPHFVMGYVLGGIAAFLSGYWVIGILLNLIKNRKLKYLSIYCWALAVTVIIILVV